eukprot:199575_1
MSLLFALFSFICCILLINADVRLSGAFTNNMVIQTPHPEKDVPPSKIFGIGFPNETIYITGSSGFPGPFKLIPNISNGSNSWGNWSVNLIPNVNDASFPGPYTISIVSKLTSTGAVTGNITINNTYFGEVFLCSGQSNMGITVSQCSNYKNEQNYSSSLSNIRMYKVPWTESNWTAQNITSWPGSNGWVVAAPSSIGYFSCVCWESGRLLTQYLMNLTIYKNKKPYVGLIESDQGGTTIYLWHAGIVGVACNLTNQLPNSGQAANLGPAYYNIPGALYNGMINPFCMNGNGISIRQAIWYQGEADSGENDHYMEQAYICSLHGLIYSWRQCFNQTLMPFITIQLPGTDTVPPYNNDDVCLPSTYKQSNHGYNALHNGWWGVQEAQFEVYNMNIMHGLVTAQDMGQNTLHYKHKLDVAKRTYLWMRYLSFNDEQKMTQYHAFNGIDPDITGYNYNPNDPKPPVFVNAYKLNGASLDVYFVVNNTGPNGLYLQDAYNCSTFNNANGAPNVCTDNCTMIKCCNMGGVNAIKFRMEGWYYYLKGGKAKTLGLMNWFPGNITKFINNGIGNMTTVLSRVVLPEIGGVNWPGQGDTMLYYENIAVRQIEIGTSSACAISNTFGIPISKGGPFNIQVLQQ